MDRRTNGYGGTKLKFYLTIKLYATIVSFVYATFLSYVFFKEGEEGIKGLSKYLYNNDIHISILATSFCLYLVWIAAVHYKSIENTFSVQGLPKSGNVILMMFMIIWFSFILEILFFSIFSGFYNYSTKKMSFFFYVIYYATFIGFLFSVRDILEAFKDKSLTLDKFYKFRYLIFSLVLGLSIIGIIYLDNSELKQKDVETISTCVSSIILLLTIGISSFLAYIRQKERIKKEVENNKKEQRIYY